MSDTDVKPEVPPRSSRWLFPALIASLALNLLFVGWVASGAWHKHHYRSAGGPDFGLMGFTRQLSDDRRKVVREQIKAARDSVRPLRQAIRTSWDEANALLTAEPFDKEKFKAAMGRVADAENQFRAAVTNTLADTAATLTADERKLLQAWREKRRPGYFKRRSKDAPDGPEDDGAPPPTPSPPAPN